MPFYLFYGLHRCRVPAMEQGQIIAGPVPDIDQAHYLAEGPDALGCHRLMGQALLGQDVPGGPVSEQGPGVEEGGMEQDHKKPGGRLPG